MNFTQTELIEHLISSGALSSGGLIHAFRKVDRADFVVPELKEMAYHDHPLPIGYDQSISQPSTVAFMLELLQPEKNQVILDLGTGAGWTAGLLAETVGPRGRVYTVEIIPELAKAAEDNLATYNYKNISFRLASPGRLGIPEFAPFEKILVSAAAEEIPASLIDQLATGGVIVLPVRDAIIKIYKRSDTQLETQTFPGFAFVPLRY